MKTALIDGDIVAYSCGFAAEQTWYEVGDQIFSTLKNAKQYCNEDKIDYVNIQRITETESLANTLQLVKNLINKCKNRTGADRAKVFLSDEHNFRERIAVTRPYKGNRTRIKPLHYDKIIEYIKKYYDTKFTSASKPDNLEADDKLGIYSTENNDCIICTIDKDLDMLPGQHYNWRKDSLYEITEQEGWYNFYHQLLTGDPVDNIVGCPGIGQKKADYILSKAKDEEGMYWLTLCTYTERTDEPYKLMLENGQLLWILREGGKIWEPEY